MKLKSRRYILLLLLLLPLAFILLNRNVQVKENASSNANKTSANQKAVGCQSKTSISENIYLFFCGEQIMIGFSTELTTWGDAVVETANSFPDLFYLEDSILLNEAIPLPLKNTFALTSTYDSGGAFKQSLGIYQYSNNNVKRILRKDFADIPGRWTKVDIAKDSPSFAIYGDLGQIRDFCGGCRIEWMDFYTWDESKQAFILDNANHKSEYRELLTKYQQLSEEKPSEEATDKIRNAEHAIEQILQGKNVSMFDKTYPVENMSCTSSSQCSTGKCISTEKNPISGTCTQEPTQGCYSILENGRRINTICI